MNSVLKFLKRLNLVITRIYIRKCTLSTEVQLWLLKDLNKFFAIQDVMRIVPMESASECAKAIVESACRGDMYVTYPSWYRVLFPWKVLHPQFVDWAFNLIFPNKSAMKGNLMMPEHKAE